MKLLGLIVISAASLLVPGEAFAFREDFNTLNRARWGVATWNSPASAGNHVGTYSADHVDIVDGHLRIKLTQQLDQDGVIQSIGGEIHSLHTFGYGTYTFRMRATSSSDTPLGDGQPVRGSVSAGFVYADNAQTEIDVEFESSKKRVTHFITWQGEDEPNQHSEVKIGGAAPHEQFYTYSFVWSPDFVEFYRDGELIEIHSGVVPTNVGKMVFNHWGTNSKWWGGTPTLGQNRYIFVDWFTYEPIY